MSMYESAHTKFMREWLASHPEEAQVKQQGRALWWDKPAQSLDEQRRTAESRVPQQPYYYDRNS